MERIRVVLSAAVTYLTVAAVVIGIFAEEIGNVFNLPDSVSNIVVGVLGAIGVAIAIIRRVTPVLPSQRGILPPPAPVRDRGSATLEVTEWVAAAVVVAAAIVFAVAVLYGHWTL